VIVRELYVDLKTASPNGSIYHCSTLEFLCGFYLSFHAHWKVVAVHGQGLFFFIAEGKILVILINESCTNTYFLL